ncbi:hypothetical protein LTR10_024094 [Elasticomyces elasticus]|uniref:DUF4345 domain-containing protein n=1 Tax=Exophiala sideris TaxID=1016849 RepID=A0ABR0J919_9EURO|nr:hypothetical protein LTR10_024094 [Elasticomyces elasticus]KAK5037408.1 hypothetical protein LTR13_004565 [Exophiala sideris]KAK5059070.1 hypothetical protein LTR69_006359 [Exophiala sideris]KAK5182903.1 hypothetical protein LTR44_004613 [Eurotiomycetes sp. CCFEE 6388]
MSSLSNFLKGVSLFSICTGTADVLLGASSVDFFAGHTFPVNSPATVFADSQLRFLGGMWAGWGVMMWWASNDLRARRTPLALLGGIMLFAGIGRVISGVKFGFGSNVVAAATAAEFVVPATIWLFGDWS